MAASTRDVSFAGADLPVLSFNHYGEQSFNDTLRVLLSTDGGQSWEEAAVVPEPNFEWNPVRLELPRWAGEPRVRVAFDFHNVCGDPYGVRWWLDDVALCGWLPTLPD